jgi:hypothetical protein
MNIFELLRREDVRLLKILRKLEDTTSRETQERELLLHQVRIQVYFLNEVLREHFYPTIAISLAGEDPALTEALEKARQEDEEIDALLDRLAGVQPWEKQYKLLVGRLVAQIKANAEWKEREIYERASRVMDEDQANTLGEMAAAELNGMRRGVTRV